MTDNLDQFVNRYLTDSWFLNKYFHGEVFGKLKEKSLSAEECFGFSPLTSKTLKSVKKFKLKEYLRLLSKSKGEINFFEH